MNESMENSSSECQPREGWAGRGFCSEKGRVSCPVSLPTSPHPLPIHPVSTPGARAAQSTTGQKFCPEWWLPESRYLVAFGCVGSRQACSGPSVSRNILAEQGPPPPPGGSPESHTGCGSDGWANRGRGSRAMPGSRPIPLLCRLEEQTRRLQKDMKKSTDADLGRWPCPALSQDGRRAVGVALLTQSPGAGFEEGALSSRPTEVPENWHEATLHSADYRSPLSLQQQPPPATGGGQLLGSVPQSLLPELIHRMGGSGRDRPHSPDSRCVHAVYSKPQV